MVYFKSVLGSYSKCKMLQKECDKVTVTLINVCIQSNFGTNVSVVLIKDLPISEERGETTLIF